MPSSRRQMPISSGLMSASVSDGTRMRPPKPKGISLLLRIWCRPAGAEGMEVSKPECLMESCVDGAAACLETPALGTVQQSSLHAMAVANNRT